MDFDSVFETEMEKVTEKYAPILVKDESTVGRYNIASNLDSILGNETGSYHTLFDMDKRSITFNVTKTVFMGKSKESFDDKQKLISTRQNINKTTTHGNNISLYKTKQNHPIKYPITTEAQPPIGRFKQFKYATNIGAKSVAPTTAIINGISPKKYNNTIPAEKTIPCICKTG